MLDHDSENKSLKDMAPPSPLQGEGRGEVGSYTKTQKLITALYMVTDIMDIDEPIRHKLRTLSVEILSDSSTALGANSLTSVGVGMSIMKIEQVMSFMGIATAMGFISEMNCAILHKEFSKLKESIQESVRIKPLWLEEFLKEGFSPPLNKGRNEEGSLDSHLLPASPLSKRRGNPDSKGHEVSSKGHIQLGVQKGSTLMKAIKDMHALSGVEGSFKNNFSILKDKRRNNILDFIKKNGGNATISDIKTNTIVQGSALHNVSEKTLQRELMSLTKDNVLYKTGEKRWSRYFMK